MPTSGMQFTAQAPLFPVFLLGVLATLPEHKAVSSTWFNEVLQAPVRSVRFKKQPAALYKAAEQFYLAAELFNPD